MASKRFTPEQIISKLREAEVGLAQGQTVGQVSKRGPLRRSRRTTDGERSMEGFEWTRPSG